jgi:hypothetical protein
MALAGSLTFAALLLVGCVAETQPPQGTPIPLVTASPIAEGCRGSVPVVATASATPTPAPVGRVIPSQVPGRYLFLSDPRHIQLYDGTLRSFELPISVGGFRRLALATDGGRVSLLVSTLGIEPKALWTMRWEGLTSTLPVALPLAADDAVVAWSPDATRVFVQPRDGFGYVAGLDGTIARTPLSDAAYFSGWTGDEVRFVTADAPNGPTNAEIWTWRPPAAPRQLAAPRLDSVGAVAWSEDGRRFAYASSTADGFEVHVRADADVVVLRERDIALGPGLCGLGDAGSMHVMSLDWSASGQVAAVLRGPGQYDFGVAIADASGQYAGVFRSPPDCYIPRVSWAAASLVVPLYGPDCGRTELDNRAAVLNASGSVIREIEITRKGALIPSQRGSLLLAPARDDVRLVRSADGAAAVLIPLAGLVDWCCAD